jgi:hypothetical protein
MKESTMTSWTFGDIPDQTGRTAVHDGALPTLRAATDLSAGSGSYWGPARLFEMNGPPVPAGISKRAKDTAVAKRLWEESEKLTGVTFAFTPRLSKAA